MPQPKQQGQQRQGPRPRPPVSQRTGQEGSRWINERPAPEDVAKWFIENAPMHDGMEAGRYVTGVTLIPAEEKVKVLEEDENGNRAVVERSQLVFVPYVKVETRVAYFWDLMLKHPEWMGVIEPAAVEKIPVGTPGVANSHLPAGFFRMATQDATGKFVEFLGCSMQVRVYVRETLRDFHGRMEGELVMQAPAGTKVVPALGRFGPDEFALMKAETGAVGRALGLAGMLVVPGSGVATAEDVQEAIAMTAGTAGRVESPAALPDDAPIEQKPEDLREKAAQLIGRLQSEHPQALEQVQAWARERKLNLSELTDTQARGVVRKLETAIAAAEQAAKPPEEPEQAPVSA